MSHTKNTAKRRDFLRRQRVRKLYEANRRKPKWLTTKYTATEIVMVSSTLCPVCGRDDFKSARGMQQHNSKAHLTHV